MILTEIQNFFNQIFASLNWDFIFFVGLGFEILLVLFFIIKSHYAYEMRMVKKLQKINSWLNKNKFIDSNNLVEFNNIMKTAPKLLRYHWHQYMLYRDKDPSHFMSPYNCIEKPLKTSSYKANIKNFIAVSNMLAIVILIFGLLKNDASTLSFAYLAKACATPVIILVLSTIFVIVLRARENMNLSAFYQYFHYFNRFIDRAVTTMPEYVDFEVLFTRKEIKKGIPILNEYLEKRARQEQEELEKARQYAIEHENYDFQTAGIDGSLVLERAMRETETFLNIRQRLLSEIEQFESEMDSLKRNYENTQKDYQKKLQTSKENVDRLRKQQEESTNRIENNYIKKQQGDEIKKQEQLEKDFDAATMRFNQEIESLTSEIALRRAELEEKRQYVEEAMKAEYQTFSTKMYNNINEVIDKRNQEEKDSILAMKDDIAAQLEDANLKISERDLEIEELKRILAKHKIDIGGFKSKKLRAEHKKVKRGKHDKDEESLNAEVEEELQNELALLEAEEAALQAELAAQLEAETGEEAVAVAEEAPVEEAAEEQAQQAEQSEEAPAEEEGQYDEAGNYVYPNGAYYDTNGIYHDEFGGWYEADGVTYHPPVEEGEDAAGENVETVDETTEEIPAEQTQQVEETPAEEEGQYDEAGNYVYPNGAYYDTNGIYHDEFGGWYEADGVTYHPPVEEGEDAAGENVETVEEVTEQSQPEIPAEHQGYYDEEGNFVYPNGSYYDKDGNYHDEYGGWFEPDGKTYHPPVTESEIEKELTQVELADAVKETGYLDENGNYVYPNGAYYDKDGIYHDEYGGWFEKDGVTYHAPEELERQIDDVHVTPGFLDADNDGEVDEDVYNFDNHQLLEESLRESEPEPEFDFGDVNAQFNIGQEENYFDEIEAEAPAEELQSDVGAEEDADVSAQLEDIKNALAVEESEEINPEEVESKAQEVKAEEDSQEDELKNVLNDNDALALEEAAKEAEKPKRKAGRPRKEVTQEPKEKRGRGRPRKVQEEKPAEKRGRGRPRKEVTEQPKEKRGRGRPRKIQIEQLDKQIADENERLKQNEEELNATIKNLTTEE